MQNLTEYEFILAMHTDKDRNKLCFPRALARYSLRKSYKSASARQRIRSAARNRVYLALPLAGLLPFGGPAGLLPFAAGALPAAALPAGAPPANALP